jgi:predicted 3-demethylubiquinone-9 3-methyltransferase (glyoxalase superfamily)
MQKISTCLWFDHQAEEAVQHYTSIFKNSRVLNPALYNEEGRGEPGKVMTIPFELEGRAFLALNGGPEFNFTPAISFMVDCQTQEEVDYYWDRLLEGGEAEQCGWLRDKFGVSWQIVPTILGELMQDKDPERSNRVMKAMLNMVKLDINLLQKAYQGED